jgi:hypothetical protein
MIKIQGDVCVYIYTQELLVALRLHRVIDSLCWLSEAKAVTKRWFRQLYKCHAVFAPVSDALAYSECCLKTNSTRNSGSRKQTAQSEYIVAFCKEQLV